jgi:hypothetical protein
LAEDVTCTSPRRSGKAHNGPERYCVFTSAK